MDEFGDIYVDKRVIAKLFDLTSRRIEQLTYDGVLRNEKTDEGMQYNLVPTIQAYIRYLSDKANRKAKPENIVELQEQKLKAEIALKESQGELHKIKTAIAAGEYISVEEARLDYDRFFLVFKKFAMSIPARVGGTLSGDVDPVQIRKIEKEMSKDIAGVLRSFALSAVEQPRV